MKVERKGNSYIFVLQLLLSCFVLSCLIMGCRNAESEILSKIRSKIQGISSLILRNFLWYERTTMNGFFLILITEFPIKIIRFQELPCLDCKSFLGEGFEHINLCFLSILSCIFVNDKYKIISLVTFFLYKHILNKG